MPYSDATPQISTRDRKYLSTVDIPHGSAEKLINSIICIIR